MTPPRLFKARDPFVYVEYHLPEDPGWVTITLMRIDNGKFVHLARTTYTLQTEYIKELQEL